MRSDLVRHRKTPDSGINVARLTRRDFFRITGGAALSFPYLLAPAGCAPSFFVDTPDLATGLSLGYTVGEITADGATVWLRAAPDSLVAVQYGKDPSLGQFSVTNLFKVRENSDHTVQITLEGLDPNSIYYYRGAVAGRTPGPIARFVTAPRRDDLAKVSFCFSGDSRESYKPFTVMDAVRAQQPDFFLHLGDTIYADRGGRARRLEQFWAKYRANRDDAATQRCFMETSFYVIWDDHEVEDDFLPDHPLAAIGRKAFLDYWPIGRGAGAPDRIYRSFRWGRALELFILDARQYRDPYEGTMLGREQKDWLLTDSARRRRCLNSSPRRCPCTAAAGIAGMATQRNGRSCFDS